MNNHFKTTDMKNTEQHEHAATGRARNENSARAPFYSKLNHNLGSRYNNRHRLAPEAMPIILHRTGGDRLQTQNLAKAPPGQTFGTGPPRGNPPENTADPPAGQARQNGGQAEVSLQPNRTLFKTEKEEMNNNNKKMKHYKHLIFNTMKKQFLFLVVFVLAAFAGSKSVFGQVQYIDYVTGTPAKLNPTSLSCATTASVPELNPTPGQPYTYEVATVPSAIGSVIWFVTDNPDIIDGTGTAPVLQASRDAGDGNGSYIAQTTSGVYNNETLPNTTKQISITWKNFDGEANTVLLVAYVKGAAGCSDNVEVWRIRPIFNFTLDLISMYDNGTLGTATTPANECVSPVESATYNAGAPETLTMNYGQNWVFFTVTAANFVDSWMPDLSAVPTYGTVGKVEWAYPNEAGSGGTWHPTTDAVHASAAATNGVVGPTGEAIVVRVQIINGNNEGLSANTVTLSVNGIMKDAANGSYTNPTLADMDEPASGSGSCVNNITDQADFIITPRPDINEVTPAPTSFIPKN